MKSVRIKNMGSGYYSATVVAGNLVNTYDFPSHNKLNLFVSRLKKDGYVVVNDQH